MTCSLLFQTQQLGARGKYPGPTAAPGLPEEVRVIAVWGGENPGGTVTCHTSILGSAGPPGVLGCGLRPRSSCHQGLSLLLSPSLSVRVKTTLRSVGALPSPPLLACALSKPKEALNTGWLLLVFPRARLAEMNLLDPFTKSSGFSLPFLLSNLQTGLLQTGTQVCHRNAGLASPPCTRMPLSRRRRRHTRHDVGPVTVYLYQENVFSSACGPWPVSGARCASVILDAISMLR